MPSKSAIGKGVEVSFRADPNEGERQTFEAAKISNIRLVSQTSDDTPAVNASERVSVSEIIAMSSFNNINNSDGSKNDYGNYYDALEATHSIITDDVTYFVSRSIEIDSSGAWTSLKSSLDADVINAYDFVDDLARVDRDIEKAISSLNPRRLESQSSRVSFQQEARNYLISKLGDGFEDLLNQNYDTKSVIDEITGDPNTYWRINRTDLISTILTEGIGSYFSSGKYSSIINYWGSSVGNLVDVNPRSSQDGARDGAGGLYWNKFSTGISEPLGVITEVLGISSGISNFRSTAVAASLSFSPNNLAAPFQITKPPPKRESLNQSTRAQLMVQHQARDGTWVLPMAITEVSGDVEPGDKKLIRDAILRGDFSFSDFSTFVNEFERSRSELETYTQKIVGISPDDKRFTAKAVYKTVLDNFREVLVAASAQTDDDGATGPLVGLLMCVLADRFPASRAGMSQQILRAALVARKNRLSLQSQPGRAQGSSNSSTTTIRVSQDSETPSANAEVTTIEVQDKTPPSAGRSIQNLSSEPPEDRVIAALMVVYLRQSGSSSLSRSQIEAVIVNAENQLNTFKIDRANKQAEIDSLQFQDSNPNVSGIQLHSNTRNKIARLQSDIAYIDLLIQNSESFIATNRNLLAAAPNLQAETTIVDALEANMRSPNGSTFSAMAKTYEDVLRLAQEDLPVGESLAGADGRTLYGGFDEAALMAMIVKCFISLSGFLNFGNVAIGGAGNNNLDLINDLNSGAKVNVNDYLSGRTIAIGTDSAAVRKSFSDLILCIDELRTLTNDMSSSTIPYITVATVAREARQGLVTSNKSLLMSLAYLYAFSFEMRSARDLLVSSFTDLLADPGRQSIFNTATGREMVSNLTTQQVVCKRQLLDKYKPLENAGYLPARLTYSLGESAALKDLLQSSTFKGRGSKNRRVLVCAIPAGTVDVAEPYKAGYEDPNNLSLSGTRRYSGMVTLGVFRRDLEFDEISFQKRDFIFDPQLYVVPGSFSNYLTSAVVNSGDVELTLIKKTVFRLYSRETFRDLNYDQILTHPRYANGILSQGTIEKILSNTVVSYLLEGYLYKTSGMIFDESLNSDLSDGISGAGLNALRSISTRAIPDLVIPNENQITSLFANGAEVEYGSLLREVTLGDRELISSIASSSILRRERPIDRVSRNSIFDRVVIVSIDPDTFSIDRYKTAATSLGNNTYSKLSAQGFLVEGNKFIPRNPIDGGFSIGDLTAQFSPHYSFTQGE